MRLVFLGDLHFQRFRLMPQDLVSKRVLGHTNLLLRRRKHFLPQLFGQVADAVNDVNPDAILLPGDFTTTALKKEFERAKQALDPVCRNRIVFGVAGNHDRYTFKATADHRAENMLPGWLPTHTPTVEQLSAQWRLMRIDSSVPRRMSSAGRIGQEQLENIRKRLQNLGPEHGLIVLCHYPSLLPPNILEKPSHALEDANALTKLLAECPARVVFVHGHIHKPWRYGTEQGAAFDCINAGAPCCVSADFPLGQGFWSCELPDDPRARLKLTHHRPKADPDQPGHVLWDTKRA